MNDAVRVGLDYLRGMESTVQVLAVHCVLKQCSDIAASPGAILAPALSTDMELREQQHQHILTPDSAKDAPALRHAHHCSVCKAARHTHRHAHTHARTNTFAHTRAHKYKHKRARVLTGMHTHIHVHTHKHTDKRAHTYKCPNTQVHTRAHTRTHTHSHARMHMHAHVAPVMGFANFLALLAMLPHLSLIPVVEEFYGT